MNQHPGSSSSDPNSTPVMRQVLRGAGLRGTPARIATLQILREASSPVTHAEVADELDSLGIDKVTVLRNLTDLVNAGLARRAELGDRLWRYESLDPDQSSEPHPHFLCIDCGSVQCMGDLELTAASTKKSKTKGRVTEILLKGHCNDCLSS
jgi:Fur family ferric uptake transcriptional regulator